MNTSIVYFCYLLNTNSTDLGRRLKQVLTHSSYKKLWKLQTEDCSRYTFLGMYAFKGLTAEHLENFKTGTGQQLQHTLGNIFSKNRLDSLFDEWNLKRYVRVAPDFDIEKHKHVFVYALMGYLYSCVETDKLVDFMNKHLIDTVHLNEHNSMRHNLLAQLNFISMQIYKKKAKVLPLKENGKYSVRIQIPDKEILAEQESKSLHYARKKAIVKAIKKMVDDNQVDFSENPDYLAILESRKELKRIEKASQIRKMHEKWLARQEEKKEARKQAKLTRMEEKKQIEERRRKAKIERKRRLDQIARQKAEAANRSMSSAKRRFLEDKGRL
ncbi:MAG: hypothetical protein EA362_00275 [Saprospirales bacterium]|nr:MAG: hypothetical protein EA362_00275 [Saprospirales bacterium]